MAMLPPQHSFNRAAILALALCALAGPAFAQTAHSAVTLAPGFHTPAPPGEAFPPNPAHVLNATVGMFNVGLIASAIALIEAWRYRSAVPVAIVIGAALCVVPESVDNYLGGCYWSQSHNPAQILYFLMGREFDDYVVIMWWAFGAVLGYVLYAALLRNVRTGTLWAAFAIAGVADILIEETLLGYGGVYTYFGHQPLVLISRFPCWWLFVNVSSLFLGVALCFRFRAALQGWKSVFAALLIPFGYIGGFAFSGMPAVFAIQGDFSPLVTQAAGLASVAVALVQTGGIMVLVLGRAPLALAARPQAQADAPMPRAAGLAPAVRT